MAIIRDMLGSAGVDVNGLSRAIIGEWTTTPPTESGLWWAIIITRRNSRRIKLIEARWDPPEEYWPDYDDGVVQDKELEFYEMASEIPVDKAEITHWLGPLPVPEPPQ